MKKITILLADDHQVVREGFRAVLERERDFSIIGEAGDGLETIRLAEQLNPNVVIVDLMMPGLNGREVVRQLKHRKPEIRLVVLSMHTTEGYVLEALKNGASAYVVKDASAAELVKAVREVMAGRRFLSSPLSEPAIAAYIEKATEGEFVDLYDTLTTREREILQLGAEGHPTPAIAARLFISPRTVETHRANLQRKLGISGRPALVRYALQRGVIHR